MATFQSNIFQVFDDLITQHRFVPVKSGAVARFASLIRRETEDVFVYVFVSDGRPGGATLDVDVWIAPPENADDSLDNLGVGYKIRIGNEYDVDDVFFAQCQCRIVHFLPCIPAIVPLVQLELQHPGFPTKRWTVYQLEQSAFSCLLSRAKAGDSETMAVLDAARRLATGKGSFAKLTQSILPIAVTLMEQSVFDEKVIEFFEGDAKWLTDTLANRLYIHALGEKSGSKG